MATTARISCGSSRVREQDRKWILALLLAIVSVGVGLVQAETTQVPTPKTKVRLIEGSDIHEGVLEYFHPRERKWLPVCGEGVQREDANVVCRELGFHGADVIKNVTRFTENVTYSAPCKCVV
eukprot:XP_001201755.2 PREDICTED: egg peptide speract receptor [Strongylocentrotus purpuratus]